MASAGALQIQSSATRPVAMRSSGSPSVTVFAAASMAVTYTGCAQATPSPLRWPMV